MLICTLNKILFSWNTKDLILNVIIIKDVVRKNLEFKIETISHKKSIN